MAFLIAAAQIYDRPLRRPRQEVSLSSFAFLFSEFIQYSQKRIQTIPELEEKLREAGERVGVRVLELCTLRERATKRETRILGILSFITTVVWRSLFGRQAEALEKSAETDDEYMISEREPLFVKSISVPKDLGHLSCASFTAGIVKGVLDHSGFPARVTAHHVPTDAQPLRTTILVKFDEDVMERERSLA